MEYSPKTDAIYFLPCYLSGKESTSHLGLNAFIVKGFNNWKKVNDGVNYALLGHVGKDLNSPYKIDVKGCEDLMK